MQHILLFGKPLIAFSTKVSRESTNWPRVMNSGTLIYYDTQLSTVIMKRIGQSACLLPNGAMIANGRASETERIWVTNDGLINQRWLKIQSIPLGKLRGIRVLTPTKRRATTHITVHHINKNHFCSFVPFNEVLNGVTSGYTPTLWATLVEQVVHHRMSKNKPFKDNLFILNSFIRAVDNGCK